MTYPRFTLSKFPITTKCGQYRVDIESRVTATGIPNLLAYIYTDRGTRWFRWELVYEKETSWDAYHDWIGKYKQFAMNAVQQYEDTNKEELEQQRVNVDGICKFNQWDGDMT